MQTLLLLSIGVLMVLFSSGLIAPRWPFAKSAFKLSATTYAPRASRIDEKTFQLRTERSPQELQNNFITPSDVAFEATTGQSSMASFHSITTSLPSTNEYTNASDPVTSKFCYVGQKLEKIKSDWEAKHGTPMPFGEWARQANLTVNRLNIYLALAQKAKGKLRLSHISFVKNVARKIISSSRDARDVQLQTAFQAGLTGMEKALEKYDGRVKFSSYAFPFIRKAVWKSLSEQPGVFLPHHIRMTVYQASSARKRLSQELGRLATDEEVAAEIGITVKRLRRNQRLLRIDGKPVRSIDEVAGGGRKDSSQEDSGGDTYGELLDSEETEQDLPYDSDTMQWQIQFLSALDMLESSEKRYLALRYGLLDGKLRSIDRVAELMCVTRDGAAKAIDSALDKVRKSPFKEVLDSSHSIFSKTHRHR